MKYARENIRRMHGYVPGEQPRDRRYIKLNTNENPYPPSPRVSQALKAVDPARLRLYPDPVANDLRDAVARTFGFERDWVLCGNGSDDLLTIAVRTFVDQGAALAHPDPTYSLYPILAAIQGARTVPVALDPQFRLPADAVERARPARLFFVARPNAPTGNAYPIENMHRLCSGFPGIVWIDEAYADFADDNCLEFVREYPNVVVSRTLSKSYSLAGVRLGFALARPELISEMLKVKDSYNVNMLTQVAAVAALEDQAYMIETTDRVRRTRERVRARLEELGFDVLPSAANFLFTRPPIPAADFFHALREHGVLVRYFPGERTGDRVRITIGLDREMDTFLAAAQAIVSG